MGLPGKNGYGGTKGEKVNHSSESVGLENC